MQYGWRHTFVRYVTSDCGGVADIDTQKHGYSNGTLDTVRTALSAGMDTDCRWPGGNGNAHYMDSTGMTQHYKDKRVAVLADQALTRLFTTQMRLGFADRRTDVPLGSVGQEVVNTAAHQQLAKEAADQSLVLLKNVRSTLPLDVYAIGRGKKIAVIGRNAMATTAMQGNYNGPAPYTISPCAGIAAGVGIDRDATFCDNGSDGGTAVASQIKSGQVVAVVLVVGLVSEAAVGPQLDAPLLRNERRAGNHHKRKHNHDNKHKLKPDEAEDHDRLGLRLPAGQDALIATVCAAASAAHIPCIVLTMNGGPLDITAARDNDNVGAIMWVGYPGQSGGTAIADAIFGRTNPSARLSMTWYPESFVKQVSLSDYRMRPDKASGYPGRTHRFYNGPTVFPFGHGLSYTVFEHDVHTVEFQKGAYKKVQYETLMLTTPAKSTTIGHAMIDVKNTGQRDGHEVVLLFAGIQCTEKERERSGAPLHNLIGFDRVYLRAGESKSIKLPITTHSMSFAGRQKGTKEVPKGWKFWTGKSDEGGEKGLRAGLG